MYICGCGNARRPQIGRGTGLDQKTQRGLSPLLLNEARMSCEDIEEMPDNAFMTIVFGHGAGAGKDHPWMHRMVRAFGAHGVEVVTFNFPYMDTGKSVPDK